MNIKGRNNEKWYRNMSDKMKKNVLLDKETVKILEDFSKSKTGSINISSGIRTMAREFKEREKSKEAKSWHNNQKYMLGVNVAKEGDER